MLRRLIKKAQTDKFGFYSRAEEIALNLPQKKMRGDDARRMFKKNGVSDSEMEELGLNDLFKQDRVTQDDIINQIEENRIEFEVTEYGAGKGAPLNISFDRTTLSFEEANKISYAVDADGNEIGTLRPYYTAEDGRMGAILSDKGGKELAVLDTVGDAENYNYINEVTEGMPVFGIGDMNQVGTIKFRTDDTYAKEVYLDSETDAESLVNEALNPAYPYYSEDFVEHVNSDESKIANWLVQGDAEYKDLTPEDIEELENLATNRAKIDYYDNPVERVTMLIDGNETPYSMIGDESGYNLSGNSDPRLLNYYNMSRSGADAEVTSATEAEVRLRSLARTLDDIEEEGSDLSNQWEKYTLVGGTDAREFVFKLKFPETKFSEDTHYPEEANQIFHVRVKTRPGPNDEKILYVEELQSDWGQDGRRDGFKDPKLVEYAEQKAKTEIDDLEDIARPLVESNAPLSGVLAGLKRALEESYNIRDTKPKDSMKFGIRSRAMSQLRNVFQEYEAERIIAQLAEQEYQIYANTDPEFVDPAMIKHYQALYDVSPFSLEGIPEGLENQILQNGLESPDGADMDAMAYQTIEDYVRDMPSHVKQDRMGDLLMDIGQHGDTKYPTSSEYQDSVETLQEIYRLAERKTLEELGLESFGALNRYYKDQAERNFVSKLAGAGLPTNTMTRIRNAYRAFETDKDAVKGKDMQSPFSTFQERAPFVTDTGAWNDLAIKYIFDYASKEGFDGVAFTPGAVHAKRWDKPKLIKPYDKGIPESVSRVFNPKASTTRKTAENTITATDKDGIEYESRIYYMDEPTKDGSTIERKAIKRRPMLSVPVTAGIMGLQALSPEEAQALEATAGEVESSFAEEGQPPQSMQESDGILDALKGAGEVAYEGLSDMVIEPFMGMSGAEAAFEMGATPEQAEAARRRAAAMVDFETSSPTGKRYKEAVKGGLGALGEYLMGEGEMGRTRSGMPIGVSRDPVQFLFQEGLVPAAEAVTEGALGIIGLDPRDTAEMERVRQEAARPFIEAIQPI